MKVAIIGAGVSGLYLAWKLAEKGEEVTVFEKKERVGKEACSGLFSERILEFIPESQKLIQNQIDFVLIHFPKKTLKIKFSTPKENLRFPTGQGKFLAMSHFELDNLTANLAEKAGAKILLNHNVTKQGLVTLQEEFDRVIGCDGANSFVRKSLELPDPDFWLAIQGFLSERSLAPFVETWPTTAGFIWKIPRGIETEYGIIEKPQRAKILLEKFLNKKGIQLPERSEGWRRTNVLRLERINSAIVPQGLIIPKNPQITLAGDSAGLTKPWSGGGVIWGLIAANLLLKNFPDFLKYQKVVKKFFLPKIVFSKMAKKIVYVAGFNFPWLLPKNVKIESDFLT